MNTLFSLRDVARLFELKESRLRYWAQTGFVNPSGRTDGRRAYTFSDLVEIKAAKVLLDAGIPLQRVRRNLQALRKGMPDAKRPLGMLRVRSDGDDLLVVDGATAAEPISGQLVLDFEVEDLGREVAQVLQLEGLREREVAAPKPRRSRDTILSEPAPGAFDGSDEPDPQSAYEWFLRGCKLDGDRARTAQATEAYEQAISLDPGLAAAHTNLGNICYQRGDRSDALGYYQAAVALDPDQPEALYNLANIYEEEGDLDMAIAEYRRALKVLPDFPDAHFNLALTLEEVGGRQQAIEHWRRYLALTPDNESMQSWRELAERHLARLGSEREDRTRPETT